MFLLDRRIDKIVSFGEFCLSESIKPQPIQFGTNETFDNNKIELYKGILQTFFEFGGKYYQVAHDPISGYIGFGVSLTKTKDLDYYDDSRHQTKNVLKVFGHVLYVLLHIVKSTNSKLIKFQQANPALGSVYDRMVKNKFVMGYIEQEGFVYKGLEDGNYIFIKE